MAEPGGHEYPTEQIGALAADANPVALHQRPAGHKTGRTDPSGQVVPLGQRAGSTVPPEHEWPDGHAPEHAELDCEAVSDADETQSDSSSDMPPEDVEGTESLEG